LAEPIERLVWQRFAMPNEEAVRDLPAEKRREVLRPVLKRVRVRKDEIEIWYEWG
jgi:hypothetical protein